MPSEAYARLWAIVGFTTLLYVLFVWSKGQGGPAIGTGIVLDDRPVVGMYYAAFVTGILLSLLCVFGIRFAAKTPQRPWCLRIPVVGLGEKIKLSTATNDLKLYQGFFIIAFVLVPSVALYHFNSQLLQDGRIWNEATTRVEKNARNEEVVVGEKSVLRVRDTLYIPFVKSIREDSSRILNAENRNHQVKLYLAEKECV